MKNTSDEVYLTSAESNRGIKSQFHLVFTWEHKLAF